jgi:hypothetical protein
MIMDGTLLKLLKSKGILSEEDLKDLHYEEICLSDDSNKAKDIVSHMYHIEGSKKYIGEKFNIHKAKEIYEEYKEHLHSDIDVWDIYLAINAQYHDYACLYHSWFEGDICDKVIESAMLFWFMDEDYSGNKVKKYFM